LIGSGGYGWGTDASLLHTCALVHQGHHIYCNTLQHTATHHTPQRYTSFTHLPRTRACTLYIGSIEPLIRTCALIHKSTEEHICGVVCCSVLQCVAVCCSVLQCVAVCCSVSLIHTHALIHKSSFPSPFLSVLMSLIHKSTEEHICRVVCCSVLQCVAVYVMSLIHKSTCANEGHMCYVQARARIREALCVAVCCSMPWVLRHVAACCSVLQCVAVCCSICDVHIGEALCVAVCCSMLWMLRCVAACCSMLQCVAVCCSMPWMLLCVAMCCNVLQCVAVYVMCISGRLSLYVAVCCSVLQCVAVYIMCISEL